jgi:TPR repeat protein
MLLCAPAAAADAPEVQQCEAGDRAACVKAGLRFASGDGVARDAAAAARCFERACEVSGLDAERARWNPGDVFEKMFGRR